MVRPIWSVLLTQSSGRFQVYLVEAANREIAIDACIRSALVESPKAGFSMTTAIQISLDSPMKVMDTGTDPL